VEDKTEAARKQRQKIQTLPPSLPPSPFTQGAIVKSIMVTANKATADVRLDATADTYTAELSFYDSATTTRGPRAKRVQFTTNGVPSKDKKAWSPPPPSLPPSLPPVASRWRVRKLEPQSRLFYF